MGVPHSTQQGTLDVITSCGEFKKLNQPGFICLLCCVDEVQGTIDLRMQELDIRCETKTLDNVFVSVQVSVQYRVKPGREKDSFYATSDIRHLMQSLVFDALRAEVPNYSLDDVFVVKEKLSSAVKSSVESAMTQFGFEIFATPVTDIDPDMGVKQAMNEAQRQKRLRRAAEDRGEAEKTLAIKTSEATAASTRIQAEAEADASELKGQGLSRQRQAIVEGLQKSVEAFTTNIKGMDPETVLSMIMITQYFDTLKEIGGNNKSSTVFVPTNPSEIGNLAAQMRQGLMEGNAGASNFGS